MKKSRHSSNRTRRARRANAARPDEPLHYVFDTDALVAAERGDDWVLGYFELVERGLARITVPGVVLVEWWHARSDAREEILRAVSVDLLSVDVFQAAGVACASLAEASIDATVMATAALRNAMVVTRDVGDFQRLAAHFPGVRIFGARSERGFMSGAARSNRKRR